jgi:hypothetical protein
MMPVIKVFQEPIGPVRDHEETMGSRNESKMRTNTTTKGTVLKE